MLELDGIALGKSFGVGYDIVSSQQPFGETAGTHFLVLHHRR